jgi:transposase
MAKRGGKRRDPARERFWRRTIRRQEKSGLGVRDFCRGEGLKDWTFRWWRQELARRDRQSASAPQSQQVGNPIEAAPSFLPVRVIDLESVMPRPPALIEIVLPSGPTVRVPAGFDPGTLGAVLSVLEGRPC